MESSFPATIVTLQLLLTFSLRLFWQFAQCPYHSISYFITRCLTSSFEVDWWGTTSIIAFMLWRLQYSANTLVQKLCGFEKGCQCSTSWSLNSISPQHIFGSCQKSYQNGPRFDDSIEDQDLDRAQLLLDYDASTAPGDTASFQASFGRRTSNEIDCFLKTPSLATEI